MILRGEGQRLVLKVGEPHGIVGGGEEMFLIRPGEVRICRLISGQR